MTGTRAAKRSTLAFVCAAASLSLLTGPLQIASAASVSPLSATSRPARAGAPTFHAARDAKTRTATPTVTAPSAAELAATAADYSSIFATQLPTLTNSGWTTCGAPITWSVDTHELSAEEAAEQIDNLAWAFGEWSSVSGLAFAFSGEQGTTYDDAAFTLTPADGSTAATRHIYLAFVNDSESERLNGNVVGLGSPAKVMPTTKEIIAGVAVFRTDHVAQAAVLADKSLYLHELGHVLGLAHASDTTNIMYPIVTDQLTLGAGDVNGVKTMTKLCPSTDPAPTATQEPAPAPTATQEPAPAPTATQEPAPAPTASPDPAPPAPSDPAADPAV